MKRNANILLILVLSLFLPLAGAGQTPNCQGLVVWNFVAEDDNKPLAQRITDEVEEILTEIPGCQVLERRKFADLSRVIENEKAIQSLSDASRNAKVALRTAEAQLVLFGTVKSDHDFIGGIRLQLKIEELTTTRVIHSNSVILSGEQSAPRNRKVTLRCFVYQLLGVPLPTECIPKKDMGWDTATYQNTRAAYEYYLEHCLYPCEHAPEASKIIADERAWDNISSTTRKKVLIAKLSRYVAADFTRHEIQAYAWLNNSLNTAEKKARKEWIYAAASLLAASGAGIAGISLENNALSKYQFYEDNQDPGDLTVYSDYDERERLFKNANQQHKAAQWLKVGSACAFVTSTYFLGKRIIWRKTLRTGNKMVLVPTLLFGPGQIAGSGFSCQFYF